MGVVISSVVAAGPAVLEDLETPYDVLVERRNRENSQSKQNHKHRLRRQQNQIHFEALKPKGDEKKNKPGHQSRSFSRNSQNTVSRPQSRNNTKTPLKRQNSLDLPVSPRQPLAASVPSLQKPSAEQPQVNNNLSVTEKIRLMLTTPREKKKLENTEQQHKEEDQTKATSDVVEGIVNEMYNAVDKVIATENLDNIVENVAEDIDKESDMDAKPQSTKSSIDRSSIKMTSKEKIEMIKALPAARQEEFKTYTQNQAGKKQSKPTKKTGAAGNKNRKTSVNSGAEQRKPEKNPRL